MVTTEELITYLAQQLNAMQADVAELQNALQASAQRYAGLTVQLFTNEPRLRRVIEAGDEATVVMSRLQALETRSTRAMTSAAQRLVKKRQITSHRHGVARRAANRAMHSRWNYRIHDDMMKVMDVEEAKEGRLTELDIKNAGMSQKTVDDFKERDKRLYHVLISCTKRGEELRVQS